MSNMTLVVPSLLSTTMSNSSPELTPAVSSSANSSSLRIPEAKDGFFGYTEEKNFQQVRRLVSFLDLIFKFSDGREIFDSS